MSTTRQAVPVVGRPRRRGRWNGVKLAVGLVALGAIALASAAAGWSALRSIGEGSGLSVTDSYVDGDGVQYESTDGRFVATFPGEPVERASTIQLAEGRTEIHGVQASLGEDRKVRLSWFDLESAPTAEQAAFVLPATAVFVGEDVEASPTRGKMLEGTRHPTYDFVLELPADPETGTPATVVDARLLLVGARVYLMRVEGPDRLPEVLDRLAGSFAPADEIPRSSA